MHGVVSDMSRQLEQKMEERARREREQALLAIYGGLSDAVERAGGALSGFSAKMSDWDCLLVLRAEFPGGKMVAFVGAADLPNALIKAVREGKRDELRWKPDKWEK